MSGGLVSLGDLEGFQGLLRGGIVVICNEFWYYYPTTNGFLSTIGINLSYKICLVAEF